MTRKYCNHHDCASSPSFGEEGCDHCPFHPLGEQPSQSWVAVWNWGDDQSLRSNTMGADYARRDFSVRGMKDWHGNKIAEPRRPDYIIHVRRKEPTT